MTTGYRNLTTICLAAALAFGLAACGGSSNDDQATVTPPPEPTPPTVYPVTLPDGHGLSTGTTSVAAGETAMTDAGTHITCAGTEECELAITMDPVTGAITATSTGGMVSLTTEAGRHAATIAANKQTLVDAKTALTAVQARYDAGNATANQVTAAQKAVDDAKILPGVPVITPPAAVMVSLPEGHGLMDGQFTVPAGGSVTAKSGATVSCTGDEACLVTVEKNEALGTYVATATGGTASVMAPPEPPVVPEPMPTVIALPAGNTVHEQLTVGGVATLTIAAGNSQDYGGVRFSCPAGGADCVVEFTDDIASAGASAPSGSGVASPGAIPNPTFGGGDAPGFLSNESLLAALKKDKNDKLVEGSGLDGSGNGYKDFTVDAVNTLDVGSATSKVNGLAFTKSPQTVNLYSTVGKSTKKAFSKVYGPYVSPSTDDAFWSRLSFDNPPTGTHTQAPGDYVPGAGDDVSYAGAKGTLTCLPEVDCVLNPVVGGALSGTGAWQFKQNASEDTMIYVADSDYITFGWWRKELDGTGPSRETQALWAGSDPFVSANVAGLLGKATYSGGAAGHFEARRVTEKKRVEGTFTGTAKLEANFGTDYISGDITTITTTPQLTVPKMPGGTEYRKLTSLEVVLGDASLSGSTFSGAVLIKTANDNHPASGSWNGQFFGNAATAHTPPSSVAGEFTAVHGDRSGEGETLDDFDVKGNFAYINLEGAFGATFTPPATN